MSFLEGPETLLRRRSIHDSFFVTALISLTCRVYGAQVDNNFYQIFYEPIRLIYVRIQLLNSRLKNSPFPNFMTTRLQPKRFISRPRDGGYVRFTLPYDALSSVSAIRT